MADTDTLPPLEDIPEDLLTKPLNPTSSRGAWAATFGGSDTNLAQRRRHNVDLVQHGQAQQAEQKARFMADLGSDKIKQDLYFRQRTLDSTIANRENALDLRERQFEANLTAKEKMDKVTGELRVAQTQLAEQRAEALANAQKAKIELASTEAADTKLATEQFLTDKQAGLFKVGSPEMADYLIDLKAKHPAIGKNTFDSLWKGTNSALSPEEHAAKKAQQAATLAGTQARTEATKAAIDTAAARLDLAKEKQDLFKQAAGEVGVAPPTSEKKPDSQKAAVPAAKERIATNPKTGEKVVFRDGSWQPLK